MTEPNMLILICWKKAIDELCQEVLAENFVGLEDTLFKMLNFDILGD